MCELLTGNHCKDRFPVVTTDRQPPCPAEWAGSPTPPAPSRTGFCAPSPAVTPWCPAHRLPACVRGKGKLSGNHPSSVPAQLRGDVRPASPPSKYRTDLERDASTADTGVSLGGGRPVGQQGSVRVTPGLTNTLCHPSHPHLHCWGVTERPAPPLT